MHRPQHNTTKLPRQLLDRLEEQNENFRGAHAGRAKSKGGPKQRKENRKAERQRKKVQRQQPRRQRTAPVEALESSSDEDARQRPILLQTPKSQPKNSATTDKTTTRSSLRHTSRHEKPETPHGVSRSPASPLRLSRGVKDKLAEDDAEIAALEKRLGMKGKTKLPKSFQVDGLDTLIDGLSDDEMEPIGKRKRSEEVDWLERKRRKAEGVAIGKSIQDDHDVLLLSEESESEDFDSEGYRSDSSHNESDSEGEKEEEDFEGFDSATSPSLPKQKTIRENPYIAPMANGTTEATAKYIPPSLRELSSSEAHALSQLRRQMQGLLNRLSEANLLSILGEVEKIYWKHPRQHVTSTLLDLLLGLLCDRTNLTDTFLILHAGFFAAVYKIIGSDFGAQLLQKIVEDFEKFYSKSKDMATGKETSNLISLLAQLYNFQLVGSTLLFDYIRVFLAEISEINTELLLKVVRISGPQLRQDDPSALKDIVVMLQPAIARVGEASLSVRTKFMVETITSLKNNRMKTGVGASAVVSEHMIQMKKVIGSLHSRNVKASEPLRVGLRDIKDTEKKGKWWLVGASWKVERSEGETRGDHKAPIAEKDEFEREAQVIDHGTADLIRLAKEQRMNTDIRRAIFITIMSASDYRDAHLRLLKLRLKRAQESEISRVLMHCAGAEQIYNPYYTLIARKLCFEHRMKMAFQFCLWDLFKRMGEGSEGEDLEGEEDLDENTGMDLGTRKIVNLAKMYGTLVAEGGLNLGVLKTLNLGFLQPKTKTFVELMLITVITHSQRQSNNKRDEKALLDIFMKIKDTPQMAHGLQYFLKKVISRTEVTANDEERGLVSWGSRLAADALIVIASAKSANGS